MWVTGVLREGQHAAWGTLECRWHPEMGWQLLWLSRPLTLPGSLEWPNVVLGGFGGPCSKDVYI